MFRYLPQSGASALWPVLFVWVLLNSCCGELKYARILVKLTVIIHYHQPEYALLGYHTQGVVTPIHSVNSFATGVKVAVKRSRWIFRRGQEVKVNF